jgi:hypothetical protein
MSVAARGWGKLPGSAGKDGRRSQDVRSTLFSGGESCSIDDHF